MLTDPDYLHCGQHAREVGRGAVRGARRSRRYRLRPTAGRSQLLVAAGLGWAV